MSELAFLKKLLDGVAVEWKALGEVTLPTSNIKWRDAERTYRYIDLTSVHIETKAIIETTEIQARNAPSRAQKLVEKDDLIFATTRPAQQRYCLIDDQYSGEIASTGYCVLRAKQEVVQPKWILHWIASCDFKAYVEENQSGSAYPAISDAKVKDFKIPIPCPDNPKKSLEIQAEIVRILDAFTAYTAELTAELTARRKQYKYYCNKLLNAKDSQVEWKTLGEISKSISSGGTPLSTRSDFYGGDIPWLRTQEIVYSDIYTTSQTITEAGMENSAAKWVAPNSVIVAISGAGVTRGRVAITKIPLATNQHCCNLEIDSKQANYRFVYYWFVNNYDDLRSRGQGNRSDLNIGIIKSYPIAIPSLAEQTRIVAILDKFDTLTQSITEGLPREIELRKKQYEYYRDLLLNFPRPEEVAA